MDSQTNIILRSSLGKPTKTKFPKDLFHCLYNIDGLRAFSQYLVLRKRGEYRSTDVYEVEDVESGIKIESLFSVSRGDTYTIGPFALNNTNLFVNARGWANQKKQDHNHSYQDLIKFVEKIYPGLKFIQNGEDIKLISTTNQNYEIDTPITTTMQPSSKIKEIKQLLDNSGQVILQGAPGCGKTYITTELAVYLCDGEIPADRTKLKNRYKELQAEGRIGFTTFHQSLDYEEFVEGYKPKIDEESGDMHFLPKKGIFRDMCDKALELANDDSCENKSCVLIIDEINRANISKVLGELITLLEKSKRLGNDDEFTVTLPYTNDTFGVPDNLYIVGTMNTADRSLGYIDYAIRRRFAFMTLESDPFVIREFYNDRGYLMEQELKLYEQIRTLINKHISEEFDCKDIMVGHSYFLAKDKEEYDMNLNYKIRPLLEEYLRDGILVENGTVKNAIKNLGKE